MKLGMQLSSVVAGADEGFVVVEKDVVVRRRRRSTGKSRGRRIKRRSQPKRSIGRIGHRGSA